MAVISRIESIGGGRWGQVGSSRQVKTNIQTQRAVFSYH